MREKNPFIKNIMRVMRGKELFDTGDVLGMVPGITRWDLVVWERQGYISPAKVMRGRYFRRVYSENDLALIQLMSSYINQGIKPQMAHQKARLDFFQKSYEKLQTKFKEQQLVISEEKVDRLAEKPARGGLEELLPEIKPHEKRFIDYLNRVAEGNYK